MAAFSPYLLSPLEAVENWFGITYFVPATLFAVYFFLVSWKVVDNAEIT